MKKNKWPIMLRTKILKFARVSTILTVFAQWYFYFRYHFSFLTCRKYIVKVCSNSTPIACYLLSKNCFFSCFLTFIYYFLLKHQLLKFQLFPIIFCTFGCEWPAFIVNYLVISKINIPLNLDVTVDFLVPEIVIGLW